MKRNATIKQIAAIVSGQTLALCLMVLAAFALSRFYGIEEATAQARGAQNAAAACESGEDTLAGTADLDLGFLDLSIGWRR